MQAQPTSASIYSQFSGLAEMKHLAKQDPEQALQQVAKQFEGVFLQMMLKSMREASLGDDIFDSDNSDLYRDMFDKQIALNMTEQKGIGLAESLVRQMRAYVPSSEAGDRPDGAAAGPAAPPASGAQVLPLRPLQRQALAAPVVQSPQPPVAPVEAIQSEPTSFDSPRQFVRHLWPHAQQAASELGVDPGILIAQAALETGWGKAINRDAAGRSSHNLFNIKADARWDGPSVAVNTLEYEAGTARREVARFRSYDSFAESFNDYVQFLKSGSRYQGALASRNAGDFVKALHTAGYATDPHYADKILNIADRDTFRAHLNQVQNDTQV
ncbi:MAG: flagellar assembly peptidoglycan hydrolase FlgJ [Gammaproteobacteria bacterium]